MVKDACREGEEITLATIDTIDYEKIDMKTMVIVGNKTTYVENGYMITPRGYEL